ncbi:MAG: PH domain-containing protein [Xenococcaceae cyanobacterium]
MERQLYKSHPVMFRNNPLGFLIAIILITCGLGVLILLFWWLDVAQTTLIVTDRRTILRKGIFSRYINEIFHSDVKNIQLRQTLCQRVFNVGNIGISTAGTSGIEIQVNGIPNPEKVREIIDNYRLQEPLL